MRLDVESISVFDSLIEGFQVIDFNWRYIYVNYAVVVQSKYPRKEDLLGFTMMEKYPGIECTPLFTELKRCMEERVDLTMENEFTFPDKSTGWFELRVQPVPKGIFILSQDITERKRSTRLLEEKVKERTAELEYQKNLLALKNKEILDSIYYARRIQFSLLPSFVYVEKNLLRLRNSNHTVLNDQRSEDKVLSL